jgi:hypothetical protein
VQTVTVTVPVRAIACDTDLMNDHLREAVNEKTHPDIVYEMTQYTPAGSDVAHTTGNLTINVAGQIQIADRGAISSSSFSNGNGGNVTIHAGSLIIDGAAAPGLFTGIGADTNAGTGNAGNITMHIDHALTIRGGGEISSSTFSSGNGGDLSITAGSISLDGVGCGPCQELNARWQVVLPALLLALGVLAALYLPVWQKREEVIALIRVTGEAQQRAAVSDALRTELERRVDDYNFALERKYAFPGAVQVLEDVTRILPDDTWLTQFELHSARGKDAPREITLRGESANAGRLVSLLEESKVFAQAAPRSPTTKIQPGPGEIFDVSAHLKAVPAPPRLPLDMTPVPTPVPPKPPATPAATARPAAGATPGAAPASVPHPAPTPGASAGRATNAPKARSAAAPEAPPAAAAPAAEAVPTAPGTVPAGAATDAAQQGVAPAVPPPAAPDGADDGFGPKPQGFAPKGEEGE